MYFEWNWISRYPIKYRPYNIGTDIINIVSTLPISMLLSLPYIRWFYAIIKPSGNTHSKILSFANYQNISKVQFDQSVQHNATIVWMFTIFFKNSGSF